MAFVRIPGGAWIFPPFSCGTNANFTTGTALTMTASAHKVAMVFAIPRDGTLDSFEFRLGTVTSAPANGIRVSFQDLDATGSPDGAQDQYRDVAVGSITSNAWVSPGLITSDGTNGGVKRTVTTGQMVAAVIEFVSFVAGNSIAIATLAQNGSIFDGMGWKLAYTNQFTASWARAARPLLCVLKYSDGYEAVSMFTYPIITFATASVTNVTSPDEIGLRYMLPFDHEIMGIWTRLHLAGTAGGTNITLSLYNSSSSLLDSSVIRAIDYSNNGANTPQNVYIPLDRYSPIGGNAVHRVAFKVNTSQGVTIENFTVSSNSHLESVDGGIEAYWTERTSAGAWTDTTTKRPWIGLKLSRIEAGISGVGKSFTYLG